MEVCEKVISSTLEWRTVRRILQLDHINVTNHRAERRAESETETSGNEPKSLRWSSIQVRLKMSDDPFLLQPLAMFFVVWNLQRPFKKLWKTEVTETFGLSIFSIVLLQRRWATLHIGLTFVKTNLQCYTFHQFSWWERSCKRFTTRGGAWSRSSISVGHKMRIQNTETWQNSYVHFTLHHCLVVSRGCVHTDTQLHCEK